MQGSSRGNNLTINVRADASKLRADLALAQAQVGALGRELRATAAESLRTGDTTAVRGLADAFENARARVTGLRGEIGALAGVAPAFAPAHRAVADLHTGFGRVGDSMSHLVNAIAPNFGSKMALGVGGAVAALVKLASGSAHAVTEISNLSKVSGFSIETIDALRDVTKKIVDRDEIGRFVVKFSDEMGKARLESEKTANQVVKDVTLLQGAALQSSKDLSGGVRSMVGEVEKLRGAGRSVRDTSDSFKAVGVDVRKFTADAKGNDDALLAWAKGLAAITDKTEQARIGVQMAGKQWMIYGAAILELDKTLPQAIKDNLKSGLGITPQMVQDAEDYRGQVADLGDAWQDASRKIGLTVVPAITFAVQRTGESFEYLRGTVQSFGGLMTAVWEKMRRDHGVAIDAIVAATQASIPVMETASKVIGQFYIDMTRTVFGLLDGLIQRQMGAAQTALEWGLSALAKLAEAARQAWAFSPKIPDAPFPAPDLGQQFAGGGRVRGPGTSTSDSIWARLSNGEFVMNARAVQRFGVGALEAMNNRFQMPDLTGFSRGGMVDAPRFATGGMVASLGSGTIDRVAVDLNWNGASFSMIAPRDVAQKLGQHARRQHMMSAIRKPSTQS